MLFLYIHVHTQVYSYIHTQLHKIHQLHIYMLSYTKYTQLHPYIELQQ
jgi:hypothetical protein